MIASIRLATFASIGIATLLAATAAQAAGGYSVSARSSTRAGNAGGTECYYNEPGIGGTGCSRIFDNGDGHTGFGLVTPASGANANRATVTSGQTGYDYGSPLSTATSSLTVDLASASLHFFAQDDGTPNDGIGSGSSGNISDELHFTAAPGATASTVTAIGVTFTVGGTFRPSGSNDNSGAAKEAGDFYGALTVGGHAANFSFSNDSTTGFATTGSFYQYPYSFDVGSWTHNADYTSATFAGIYYFTGASSDTAVTLGASFDCADGLICGFGNSLQLSLPTGVSYTSDSGVFLTAGAGAAGAVPEPANWAMLVAGFGIVGIATRRRRVSVAA